LAEHHRTAATPMLPLSAQTFLDHRTFTALVAGFAAFSSVVTFASAFAGVVSWLKREQAADVANAAAIGLAIGCVGGMPVAALAILDSLELLGT
jgi:hypothetical protein